MLIDGADWKPLRIAHQPSFIPASWRFACGYLRVELLTWALLANLGSENSALKIYKGA